MREISLGKTEGRTVKIAADANNSSILITGMSGSGKTRALQKISRGIASDGGTVLMVSFHGTQAMMADNEKVKRINIRKDGIPFSMMTPACYPDGSMEDQEDIAEAVTDIFSDVLCLGSEQKITFQKAVQRAVERVDSHMDEMEVIGQELKELLEEGNNRSVASKIYGKFDSVFKKVRMSAVPDILQPGRVTILDLDGFSTHVQKMLSELILSILWRYYRIDGQRKEEPLYIVCDEFQNLSIRSDSVLGQILCEGRKFHVAMLLATQTLERFDRSQKALLLQAATQICFRPGPDEVKAVFKRLGAGRNSLWEDRMSGWQRGECIAYGRLCIGTVVREGPVKMTFRESPGSGQRLA